MKEVKVKQQREAPHRVPFRESEDILLAKL